MAATIPQSMTICQVPTAVGRRPSHQQDWVGWLGELLVRWHTRSAERRIFEMMTDRELSDSGLSRSEIGYELSKPFWRD